MDQLHLLFLLSFSMLIGSFISGMVPLAFRLSDSKSRLLALMGSGILVGTALSIIIPEGIDSMTMQPTDITHHLKLESQTVKTLLPDETDKNHNNDKLELQSEQQPVQTFAIGVSLVAGFVLMLFIDQFSLYQTGGEAYGHGSSSGHSSSKNANHDYMQANQTEDESYDDDDDEEVVVYGNDLAETINMSQNDSETKPIKNNDLDHRITMQTFENKSNDTTTSLRNQASPKVHDYHQQDAQGQVTSNYKTTLRSLKRANKTKVTPTLGLVIHAAADGIALGAAATTSHRHVEMIIFLAIMLHKAPAAFSLVVFLLHRGLKHSTIRQHLLAFSLSAPLAALLTYFGLSQSGKEALRRNNATGIAMLFSAGTFLYVATVHVLPELVHNQLLSPKEMLFLVGGAFLPILLAQTV